MVRKQLPRALAGLVSLVLLIFLFAPSAHAFDARTGDQVTIGAGQIIDDDLYVAGQSVTIDGTIHGDVFAAGQVVILNGAIDGSLVAVGQTVIVNGSVRDSARVAAQAIQLGQGSFIGRDLMSAAYSLEQRPDSAIGRDLAYAGYQALLAGQIGRNIRGDMRALALHGVVGGNVDVAVGSEDGTGAGSASPPPGVLLPVVPTGLSMTDDARVGGHLSYTASRQFPLGGYIGEGVSYAAPAVEIAAAPSPLSIVADNIRRLIAIAAVGLLLLWLTPRAIERLTETMETKPLPSIGWGFVAAVGATVAVIAIAVATIMLAIAFGVATLWNLLGLVIVLGLLGEAALATGLTVYATLAADAMVSYLGGRILLRKVQPRWAGHRVMALAVGLPIFVLVTAFPVLGPVIGLLAALAAFGALWIRFRDRKRPSEAAEPIAPVAAAA